MKRYLFLYLLVLAAPVLRAQPASKRCALVFIGNSITYGATLAAPATMAPPATVVRLLEEKGYTVRYANCGFSGSTTLDFLPATGSRFASVLQAADSLYTPGVLLVFSIILGTNDSAIEGPNGAPVSPDAYRKNLQQLIDQLHARYPGSRFVLHRPIWYSPNTHNRSAYLQEGLNRLQTYTPQLEQLVNTHPDYIFKGDRRAFAFFKKHYQPYFTAEKGSSGIFYLHPNAAGAMALGRFWADALLPYLHLKKK